MADVNEIISKLQKLSDHEQVPLSNEELDEVRGMLRAWTVLKTMGIVGKIAIWLLVTVAGLFVAWDQIKTGLGKWL